MDTAKVKNENIVDEQPEVVISRKLKDKRISVGVAALFGDHKGSFQ